MRFYDTIWKSYAFNEMRTLSIRESQVKKLYPTGLCEGSIGRELMFLPTRNMESLHKSILSLYNNVKVKDHKVELCNEVFYTSRIEGSTTTYKRTVEIHDGRAVDYSNYFSEMMIKSGFNATKYLNVHGNKLTEDILIEMWNILVDGCCSNEDIRGTKYRTGEVQVGNHTGVYSGLIPDVMSCWIDYYNSDKLDEYPFIKASLLHVSYEMIHPFCDGNGRSGRLLMINYLISRGYDKCKAISFSRKIAEYLQAYYLNLSLSDNVYSDCTPFIEYMLNIFNDTFHDILFSHKTESRKVQFSKSLGYYIIVNNKKYQISRDIIRYDENNIQYVVIDNKRYNLLFRSRG